MFADPQSLTVGGGAKSFVRIGSATPASKGSFKTGDEVYRFDVSQNGTSTRKRREVRLTKTAVAADPISAVNKEVSASVIIVIDEPNWGFDDTTLIDMITGLIGWFSASTYANGEKLLDGEL
nr:MAG: hypothetical protein 2 [Leviviridae sp.]